MFEFEFEFIFKSELKSYDNSSAIINVSTYITDFDDLLYFGNLNKDNQKNGIVGFFFDNGENIGMLMILPYSKSQNKLLNFKRLTFEISSVFVYEKYRGKGYCDKMISNTINYMSQNYHNCTLKVTFVKDNIPAYKCYSKYFEEYNNPKSIEFLKELWKLEMKFKSLIINID
jgi:predicted acetyltransferase